MNKKFDLVFRFNNRNIVCERISFEHCATIADVRSWFNNSSSLVDIAGTIINIDRVDYIEVEESEDENNNRT